MGGRPKAAPPEINEALLTELRECLAQRCIEQGLEALHNFKQLLESLDSQHPLAARFLPHLAQWIDVGAFEPAMLKFVLGRFDAHTRAHLAVRNYLYLRMAEGMLAMVQEEIDAAIRP